MIRLTVVSLAIAIVISGCVSAQIEPSKQIVDSTERSKPDFAVLVKSFGDDTKAISDKVKVIFTEINSAQLNADITWLADKGHLITTQASKVKDSKSVSNKLNEDLLNLPSIPTSTNGGNSNSYFAAGQFRSAEPINRGITALSNYGNALSSLAVAGSRKDMELASANLYAAALKVDADYQALAGGVAASDTKKDIAAIVSSAIVELGTFYNAHQRNIALKKIINAADPKIQTICKELNRGLTPDNFGQLIALNRQKILWANVKEYNNVITSKPTTLAWRENEIKRLVGLKSDLDTSTETTVNANKAISAVADAHAALLKAVNENKLGNDDLFKKLQNLKDMAVHAKSYKEMLLKCTSGKYKSDDSGAVICQDNS